MNPIFRDFFNDIKPIKMREQLVGISGAFRTEDDVLEYSFADTVKMAGHVCPTVSGAYVSCQKALEKLYPDEIPVRGDIAVTVYGAPDDGVYGVIGQVFSFVTGAAPNTGFKGLGTRFKRKDLLKFKDERIDPSAMCFEFRRLDNKKAVLVKFYSHKIPYPREKEARIGELIQKVVWDGATGAEKKEFQELWTDKVKTIVLDNKDIDKWMKVESVIQ
ncbi:MAG: hypothetical protein HZA48_00745 [Planctomycetes bacterium]|nr:hypothetical protein [Planctomycetota bacterium]